MRREGLILAIDGARRDQPLVLLASDRGEIAWCPEPALPEPRLVRAVAAAMKDHRGQIDRVLAVRGPGSYIGVRGGLAAALGAAQALRRPLAMLGSLELVAAACEPAGLQPLLALADAGRGGTYGQLLEPARGERSNSGWRPTGPAQLLGRDLGWPPAWAEAAHWTGQPGEGRALPPGLARLEPVRDRLGALAWAAMRRSPPISGYDQVTADYGETLGAER
ncbi:MAG: hypothetical protein ACREOA_03745 [Candidatus Dormibacteria bacterium]